MELFSLINTSILETLYMVFFSSIFSTILGIPLGILLVVTSKDHICPHPKLNMALEGFVNFFRSVPFIILIILIFPLSRFIVGTTIGSTAAIVPLSIGAAPFVARIVESSLRELDYGIIEASIACGASNFQIIFHVMLRESIPSLILGATITIINIIGYSAMAGAVGGGGLGDAAIRYGYQRFQSDVLFVCVVILVAMVGLIQLLGNNLSTALNKK